MKTMLLVAAAVGATLIAAAPAEARQGCGLGAHRGPYGHCRPNVGPALAGPDAALTIGTFYPGHGYWDGSRYWHRRYRWHGGWRYR